MLDERELSYPSVGNVEMLLNDWNSRTQDVLRAPAREWSMSGRCDGGKQIPPRRVSVAMGDEEIVNPRAERAVTDEVVELFEHARRLVVDDRAVVALRLIEVRQLLPDGRGSGGDVDVVRRRLVAEIERHP